MSATYPSFVRVLAIEGSVWLFAGYFMMEVVGCAKYPFNTDVYKRQLPVVLSVMELMTGPVLAVPLQTTLVFFSWLRRS